MIDLPDMSRVDLAKLFAENGYRSGAEIGTGKGDYAYSLARANRKAKVYCIDPWPVYGDCDNIEDAVNNKRKAADRLRPYSNVVIITESSAEALRCFEDGELDFVYIDADHTWPHITHDLYHWSKKVRSGGIVSGHDYLEELRPDGRCHVKSALIGYTDAFKINEWYVIGRPDWARSWYWIKP